jgi:hypothetical protein
LAQGAVLANPAASGLPKAGAGTGGQKTRAVKGRVKKRRTQTRP